jgi:transposase
VATPFKVRVIAESKSKTDRYDARVLVPIVRSSGDSVWTGGITRLGSRPLRHALVEASINAIRQSPALRRMYSRILYRGNIQKARVAVARKLAVIIYAMLRRNEPFRAETAL